ncbi:Swi5-domain-containing protein [Pyrenochaeta sp. MPI-SDFR-AT-0127]|nr:Swi5-domain-containing protein [Pyrenochaeta sp. MPI-SDFR-AT-0127]
MAVAKARGEVPDSEDEPMTSSPVSVPDEAVDKLSATAPVSFQAPQDATQESSGTLRPLAEWVGSNVPERTDGLDAERSNASPHLDASMFSGMHVAAMHQDRALAQKCHDCTGFQTNETLPRSGLGPVEEPTGHDAAAMQNAQAGHVNRDQTTTCEPGASIDQNQMEDITDTHMNTPVATIEALRARQTSGEAEHVHALQSPEQRYARTEMPDKTIMIQADQANAESERGLLSNTLHEGVGGIVNHKNPLPDPHGFQDTPGSPSMAARGTSSILHTGTRACEIRSAEMQNLSMAGTSSQARLMGDAQDYARQTDGDVTAADSAIISIRPLCTGVSEYPDRMATTTTDNARFQVQSRTAEVNLHPPPAEDHVTELNNTPAQTVNGGSVSLPKWGMITDTQQGLKHDSLTTTVADVPALVPSEHKSPAKDMKFDKVPASAATDSTTQPKLSLSQQPPPTPIDTSHSNTPQEMTLAELKSQKRALLASLAALPAVQILIEEAASSEVGLTNNDSVISDLDVMSAANKIVKGHIKLLHEYNEMKDVGQGLMGLIADQRGVRIVEVQDEFGIDSRD